MAYPKKLINDEGHVVMAKQEVHEADLIAAGYHVAPDEPKPLVTVPADPGAPTPCAKCSELEEKVAELQAKLAAGGEPVAPVKRGRGKAKA